MLPKNKVAELFAKIASMTRFRYILPLSLFFSCCAAAQTPAAPTGVVAIGYESHVELHWQPSPETNVTGYKIYRSQNDGASFEFLKQVSNQTLATDWTGDEGQNLKRHYKITAATPGSESTASPAVVAETRPMNDEELMEMVQHATFRYFWDYAHPVSGLARERNNGNPDIVTTGGSGFGIMTIVVGAERGWVTRAEAVNRMIQIVSFLQFADRFHGVWPHWMDGKTGNVIPFSQYDNGGDLVESAFMMQGLLAARQYFDQNTPLESALRDVITGLWEDMEWDWYRKNNGPVLYWHWSPEHQWKMNFPLRGFYEAQIVYILAAASPTHPVPASLYQIGWTSSNYGSGQVYFGYPLFTGPLAGGPLFFAHYSYLGFDPRNKKDAFCNYFVRNRNHALVNRQFCINNSKGFVGYSADCWGTTSSDDPNGYSDHQPTNDNGTIAPTAALASMPYTPAESMAALRHFYRNLGEKTWGVYGFYDAFNQTKNWYATSYLAIDQGPIVAMIENHRTALLWNMFMKNPEIQPALDAIGFKPDFSGTTDNEVTLPHFNFHIFPNPVSREAGSVNVEFNVLQNQILSATLFDAAGHQIRSLFSDREFQVGTYEESLKIAGLAQGFYTLKIQNKQGGQATQKLILK